MSSMEKETTGRNFKLLRWLGPRVWSWMWEWNLLPVVSQKQWHALAYQWQSLRQAVITSEYRGPVGEWKDCMQCPLEALRNIKGRVSPRLGSPREHTPSKIWEFILTWIHLTTEAWDHSGRVDCPLSVFPKHILHCHKDHSVLKGKDNVIFM